LFRRFRAESSSFRRLTIEFLTANSSSLPERRIQARGPATSPTAPELTFSPAGLYVRSLWEGITTPGHGFGTLVDAARRHVLEPVAAAFKRRIAFRWLYEEPTSTPFVLFPLHWAKDAQITVREWPYRDQIALIENLARSIPIDTRLLVKEHPIAPGAMSVRQVRRIRSLGNVGLVPPSIPARQLIPRSQCVVVINSTAGLESLALGKPTVALGRTFYTGLGLTHDVTDMRDLPSVVGEAINGSAPDPETVEDLIGCLLDSTYRVTPHQYDMSEGNMSAAAQAVVDVLTAQAGGIQPIARPIL
jgi:hypothetical protein